MDEQAIFLAALERDDPDERAAYVEQACGDDDDLRRRVRELLQSHEESEGFLERPYLESVPTEFAGAEAGDRPSTAGEEPTRVEETADDSVSLHFLAPSDEPDHLGRLGPYEISEVIGRGGMGVVLKGYDARLNRVVAIKVLSPVLASDAMARKRFLREARAAAAVSHPHVITIHAVEGSADPPYLVMECVDGSSLQQKLDRDGALPLVEIVRVGAQVASGLAAAHEQGLIHRDVKPSNILLENGVERVKITDFGLARAVDDVGMTRTGEVAGTPQYMSPEQAESRHVDQRSDLFSLGCVLYAMCTGRSPFRADSTPAALRRVCDDRPRPIREINPDIPGWLVELIDRLLAKDPRKRLPSARVVADEFQRQLAELQFPILVQRASASNRWTGLIRRRPRVMIGLSVALLALVSLGVTEATEVTQVREIVATLLRVRTPQGTLVVRVADPSVGIVIEGDGGLVINGAGPQQVRLEPGQYQLQAIRNGEPVYRELVTIRRGGRRVVDVRLERQSTRERPAAGGDWVSLFNGQNLDGWHVVPEGRRGQWTVEDGVIAGRSPSSFLVSDRGDFENFHLRLEVNVSGDGDSGICFRADDPLAYSNTGYGVPIGYEANIEGTNGGPNRTGTVFRVSGPSTNLSMKARVTDRVVSPETWFTFEIIAAGNHVSVKVDGETASEFVETGDYAAGGHLALQVNQPGMVARFRRLQIRELEPDDLSPWVRALSRADTHAAAAEWDQAARDYIRALERLPEDADADVKANVFRRLADSDEVFVRAVELSPEAADLWLQRGEYFARISEWERAVHDYATAMARGESIDQDLPGNDSCAAYPFLLLLAGHVDAYRDLCQSVVGQPERLDDWKTVCRAVVVCTLSPESGIDPAQCVEWAETAVHRTRDRWSLRALAAAMYRAGRFDRTTALLEEVLSDYDNSGSNVAFLLALAHHHLGHEQESREWYEIGMKALQTAAPSDPAEPVSWSLLHWLNVNVWHREAKAVFEPEAGDSSLRRTAGGLPPPPPPAVSNDTNR
jgi:tetratricopeptide (TPR) repeat protein